MDVPSLACGCVMATSQLGPDAVSQTRTWAMITVPPAAPGIVRAPPKKKPACEGTVLKNAGSFKGDKRLEFATTPGAQKRSADHALPNNPAPFQASVTFA